MSYTPTTQGGAAPSSNPMSGATGDFDVVTNRSGGRVQTGEAVLDSRPGRGDPNRPQTSLASELLRGLVGKSSTEILEIQKRLNAAGYRCAVTGVPDADTRKAYADLLMDTSTVNSGGENATIDDILNRRASNLLANGTGPGGGGGVDVVNVADPASLREAAHAAFKAVTGKGRAVDDKKVQQFVQAFTAAQVGSQRTTNRAQNAAAALTATGVPGPAQEVQQMTPDLGSRATEFAQNADPAGAGAHKITEKFDMFIRLLGGIV